VKVDDKPLSRLLPLLEPPSRATSSIRLGVALFGLKGLLLSGRATKEDE